MDGKVDVKSLMAKFNSGNIPSEVVSPNSRPFKAQGNSGLQARTAAFEKFNQPVDTNPAPGPNVLRNALSPKPPFGTKPLSDDKTDNDPKFPLRKCNSALHKLGSSVHSAQTEADGKAVFPKPAGFKPTELQKEESKPPFSKSPVHKTFLSSVAQENGNRVTGSKPSLPAVTQENEVKYVFPKPSEVRATFTAASQKTEPKPPFPKKPVLEQKKSIATQAFHNDDSSNKTPSMPKGPMVSRATKPNVSSLKPTMGNPDSNNGSDSPVQGFPAVTLKPTIRSVQSPFLNQNTEENNDGPKPSITRNVFLARDGSGAANVSTSKFQKPNLRPTAGGSQEKGEEQKDSTVPKRKLLPPVFTLGPAPQKSPRPPNVDLERFIKPTVGDSLSKGLPNKPAPSHVLRSSTPPPLPPPVSHPSTQAPLPPFPPVHIPTHPPAPSLPPRNIKPATESIALDGGNYDDVEFHSSLEGNQAHGSLDESEESDQEMYEGIDDFRSPSRKEQEIRKEKEEKKRQELEKKEQKEKEKKEQEIRKRFKLVGSIEVLHQARACVDYKGGKNELSVKQGDQIEIIRITDNPEGKWLGRVKDSYGFIKTTLVEINYESLKRRKPIPKQEENDQEVYDDVGEQDSINRTIGGSGSETFFPPPPDDDEIYDGIDEDDVSSVPQDEEKPTTWAWGLLKMITGKDDKKKIEEEKRIQETEEEDLTGSFTHLSQADAEEVYDDVEDFPPPPKNISSLGINMKSLSLGRGKGEEKDIKKFKKMEKEEKEFKKKFKYDGEIRILYSAQVSNMLAAKKWGAKDLPLKPGESLEVIQETDDAKVLCRNDEGKYGYVLRSNLMGKDGDIYDDIGDGCIYDND
ncbi:FYN-binding protein 1 isoform X2 [Rhinatrema bivittatum]|uniref:FYN-binding protein 1 isoform X2 n=1 Tax=Rhinatrema bivittatum TaxID=194408 RepID=UPI00112C736C|nr:FYN-binding protein 1 isoform X2 [Rhinatrema bivittatum]